MCTRAGLGRQLRLCSCGVWAQRCAAAEWVYFIDIPTCPQAPRKGSLILLLSPDSPGYHHTAHFLQWDRDVGASCTTQTSWENLPSPFLPGQREVGGRQDCPSQGAPLQDSGCPMLSPLTGSGMGDLAALLTWPDPLHRPLGMFSATRDHSE